MFLHSVRVGPSWLWCYEYTVVQIGYIITGMICHGDLNGSKIMIIMGVHIVIYDVITGS